MLAIPYLFGIVGAVVMLVIVLEMLRRRKLRERHALWWMLAGIIALIAAIFPQSVMMISEFLGFESPINLIFFSSFFVLFLVALQHSSELTELESHNRLIVERLTLLESKLENNQNLDNLNA